MNDDRWYDLVERLRSSFGLLREEEEALEHGPGKLERVEFDGPMGRMRLERATRPVVQERRTHYSRRIGGDTSEEFVYAEGEFTHHVTLLRRVGLEWHEEDFRGMMG